MGVEDRSFEAIIRSMNNCSTEEETFAELKRYFEDKGFGGVCYVTPEMAGHAYRLYESGMPAEWMHRYTTHNLAEHDPIPNVAFRTGRPIGAGEAIERAGGLSSDERAFVEAFKSIGLTSSLLIPTFGPLGRPALVGAVFPGDPETLNTLDLSLASAVAHQAHVRMELLRKGNGSPALSPKERQVVKWMARGKSNSEIGTILDTSPATIATHVGRIYAKLGVNDRVTCVAKALAHHYI